MNVRRLSSTCGVVDIPYDMTFDASDCDGESGGESVVPGSMFPDLAACSRGFKRQRSTSSSPDWMQKRSRHNSCKDGAGGISLKLPTGGEQRRGGGAGAGTGAGRLHDLLVSPTRISIETVQLEQLGEGLGIGLGLTPPGLTPPAPSRVKVGAGVRDRGAEVRSLEEEFSHAGFECYEQDIYQHRRSMETCFHPVRCLRNQPEVTQDMRTVLIDWLTKMCHHFHLGQGTLCLTVNIMDRFLFLTPVSRDCFQLLGITTFLIASKQEEVTPPEIEDLVRLCCHAYDRNQVLQLELIILNRLHFDLLIPTVQFFLEYYCSSRMRMAAGADYRPNQVRKTRAVGRYLLEQCLKEYEVCQFKPSLLALATLEVADGLLGHRSRPMVRYYGGHNPNVIDDCCRRVRIVAKRYVEDKDMEQICEKYWVAPYET